MTTDATRWLEELSTLEQENALLKSRLETCEASYALLQAEVMRYRHLDGQACSRQTRDRLLEMTAIAANTLLTTENFDAAVNVVLEMMGEGLETDRMAVIEIFEPPPTLLPHWKVLYEWTSPGIPQQMSNPDWIEGSFDGIEDIYDQCCRGQPVSRLIDTMAEPFRSVQAQLGVKGLYVIPIFVNSHLWGVVGFDDCRVAKQRSMAELSTLKIAANCIGSAIQRQRTQQALIKADDAKHAAILEERNRMASELHDTLAQSFTGISLQLEVAKPLLERDPPAVSAILNHIKDLAEDGLAAARKSVWALYPAPAAYADIAQLLYESLEAMSRNTSTQIEVNVHGMPYPLPIFISMNLLRIGQEAVTNALKHSQAKAITIDLTYKGNNQTGHDILLNVCDDGCGFTSPTTPDAINDGFGLVSMSERCNRIGAQLSIISAPGKGTRVSVEASLP